MNSLSVVLSMLHPKARRQTALLGLVILVNTALEIVGLIVILPYIEMLVSPDLRPKNETFARFVDALAPSGHWNAVAMLSAALFVFVALKGLFYIWTVRMQGRFGTEQAAYVSSILFQKHLRAPFERHLNTDTSEVITTVDRIVDGACGQVLISSLMIATELTVVVGILGLMLFLAPGVTLLMCCTVGLTTWLLLKSTRKRLRRVGERAVENYRARLKVLQNALANIQDIKITATHRFFLKRYRRFRFQSARAEADAQFLAQLPRPILEIGVFGVMLVAVLAIVSHERTPAEATSLMGVFAIAAFRMTPAFNRIVSSYNTIRMNNPALERVHRDHTSVVPERLWGQSLELQAKRAFSSIRFEGVCFEYANAPNAAIQDLNLEIKRGECIGIVGRSGSGKSTLAAMLAALLLPTRGRVFVDGVDMQSNIRHWRRRVAYVQQNPKLLEDTIRANVAFGVPDEFIDDSRVRQCLDDVGLGDLVRALNNGLHETIGEKGVRFSGGEAQKLAIARAIYRSASVLVLDESTSSLDQESQEKIVDLVSGLKGRMTIVAIAHRTRTLQICDTIAVMDKGRLVALGPRESLADEHQVLFEDGARA